MTDAIVVVVGEWECGGDGEWQFVVEKDVLAQCIMMPQSASYLELRKLIEAEFCVKGSKLKPIITFWNPADISPVEAAKAPAICIKSDAGVRLFMEERKRRKGIGLFVSFESECVRDINTSRVYQGNGAENTVTGKTQPVGQLEAVSDKGGTSRDAEALRVTGSSDSEDIIRLAEETTGGEGPPGARAWVINASPEYMRREQTETRNTSVACRVQLQFDSSGESRRQSAREKGKAIVLDNEGDVRDGEDCVEVHRVADSEEDSGEDKWGELDWSDDSESSVNESDLFDSDEGDAVVPDTDSAEQFARDAVVLEIGGCSREEVRVGYGWEPLVEVGAGSTEKAGAGGEERTADMGNTDAEATEDENIESTLASIHREIREGGIIASRDAPAVFDDGVVPTCEELAPEFDDADDSIYIGRTFRNKAEMQHIVAIHAIKRMFTFRQVKSDRSRVILKCVDRKCPWRVFAHVRGGYSRQLEVRTARLTHTCDINTRSNYGNKASAKVISRVLKKKFGNGKIGPRAVDIPDVVLQELRVSINYMKAWRAKEMAVTEARGSDDANYKMLTTYMKRLASANPGTVYNMKTTVGSEGEKRFEYLFFAMGASISAIPYLRKVLVIDGTVIKSKFQGCLLTASFQDGNFKVFPLGFGVVDGENEPAWTWFLTQLAGILPDSQSLMIISDRHSAIYAAIQKVYPRAHHGACSIHLGRNVKARFKEEGLAYLVSRAARAYSVGEFRRWFTEIENRNIRCADYLREVGLSHWTQVYAYGMRYNLSSTNIAETLNSALSKALQLPILSMVESIRMKLMQWFCMRRHKADKLTTTLTKEVEKKVLEQLEASTTHTVVPASAWVFQVNVLSGACFTLDLQQLTCSCRMLDKLQLPCSHAIAAARFAGIPIPNLASAMYTAEYERKVYEGVVKPVPDMDEAFVPGDESEDDIHYPHSGRGAGRPRKRRVPSMGEHARKRRKTGQYRCSTCHERGHNKATCKNPIP